MTTDVVHELIYSNICENLGYWYLLKFTRIILERVNKDTNLLQQDYITKIIEEFKLTSGILVEFHTNYETMMRKFIEEKGIIFLGANITYDTNISGLLPISILPN